MREEIPWKRLWEQLSRYRPALLVLAVGLALLLWPRGGGSDGFETTESENDLAPSVFQTDLLERRMEQALSRIQGVGEATVVLTLRTGAEQVLASDKSGEEEETVVLASGSGRQQTVTVQERSPQYLGALVVCPGGGDPQVKLQVMQAVQALTGLRANQISICEGTGGS